MPEPTDGDPARTPATTHPVPDPARPEPGALTPPEATPAPDYDEHGTPSFEHVRDRIEARYATSLGATELAEDTDRVRDQAEQQAERDRKAAERLEEIRRSLG